MVAVAAVVSRSTIGGKEILRYFFSKKASQRFSCKLLEH